MKHPTKKKKAKGKKKAKKVKINYNYSKEDVQAALKAIKDKNISIRQAAVDYHVPKSTLADRKSGKKDIDTKKGAPTVSR